MRIATISYHTCPLAMLGGKDTGGMNVYVRNLTHELGRLGVHVDVFTRSQDEHVPHVVHQLGYGNRVVHIPAGPERPVAKDVLLDYVPEFVDGVHSFVRAKGLEYDAIHSHYWLSGVAAAKLSECWSRIPILHMYHTLGVVKQRVARSARDKDAPQRIAEERRLLEKASRIIVSTSAEQDILRTDYGDTGASTVVIPPGVDTEHFYPIPSDEAKAFIGLGANDRIVLFVGRIEPIKGIETLIRAMSMLRLDAPGASVRLAIIGGDPDGNGHEAEEIERLQGICSQLGLDRRVVFLGKRSQDTLPYYYSAAEVVVMPSQYESFGIVALEAMACGTPVIASDVGGLGILVRDGETGFTVPESDFTKLAARLRTLLADKRTKELLGKQAAQYALGYAWPGIADRMLALYRDVTGKR